MVLILGVLTFIAFLLVDYFVLKSRKKEHSAFASFSVFNKASLAIPVQYLLSKGHIWMSAAGKEVYKLGIDEFIVKSFKRIQLINVVPAGTEVKKGDVIFAGKVGSNIMNFRSPVDGVVTVLNNDIIGKNIQDTYTNDWSLQIKVAENAMSASEFTTREKASRWLDTEFKRFKDFLSIHTADPELAGLTMADGGNIVEGVAGNFNAQTLTAFEQEFLSY